MKLSTTIHVLTAVIGGVITLFTLLFSVPPGKLNIFAMTPLIAMGAFAGVALMHATPGLLAQLKQYDLLVEVQQGCLTFAEQLQTARIGNHGPNAQEALKLAQQNFALAKANIAEHPLNPWRALQSLNHARFHLEGLPFVL